MFTGLLSAKFVSGEKKETRKMEMVRSVQKDNKNTKREKLV